MNYAIFFLLPTAIDSAISMNDQAVKVDVINILNELCHFFLFQTAIDSAISMNDQAVIVDVINILNAKA